MRKLVEISSITVHVNETEFSDNMTYFKYLRESGMYIQIRSINRMQNDVIITFSLFIEEELKMEYLDPSMSEVDKKMNWEEPQMKLKLEALDMQKITQGVVDDVTNIIDFKEIQAKMGSKLPPDGNWIKDFKAGTRFLAYMKANSASILWDFILGTDPKELPAIYLGYENGPQGFGWRWHDPVKFCKEFGLYSTLEVSDGNSNTLSDGTVEGDGKPQIIPPVHESE